MITRQRVVPSWTWVVKEDNTATRWQICKIECRLVVSLVGVQSIRTGIVYLRRNTCRTAITAVGPVSGRRKCELRPILEIERE